ncbi:MAG TPA: DegT/DnrJ/EryC1/StrS family aminotransferase [Gemmatimonadales bacterium]|nr:DegT/DnrJ/EryC1/StrS family aminotransferase [Gemmatimonadales bacterium]
MDWRITLSEPELGAEEIAAVTRVLESGWLTMGAVTGEFERAFAARMGVKHAFAVNNATAALHLANLAVGVGPGDEVICPDLTFVATANATRYTGAEVVLADVRSADDLTIDPADVERRITPRTRAITVVHYAGFPCDMDAILDVARRHGLAVIEDCAHAPFAWLPGADGERRHVGAIGDVGCFSFFGNKNMTTGEGGMVTTNDDALAERIRLLRSHGMTTLTYERHKGHASGYDVVALGYNYRSDELHSAVGLAQLAKVDRLNAKRREVWGWYREAFAGSDRLRLPFATRPLEPATCHIMPVQVAGGAEPAAQLRQRLLEARIQTSKHYTPISCFSTYRAVTPPVTAAVAEGLVTLPLGPTMTRDDVALIAEVCAA